MSSEPRKSSEILLDLESRLGRIEAEIKLYNAGQSLILKKLNEISAKSAIAVAPLVDVKAAGRHKDLDVSEDVVYPQEEPQMQVETNFDGIRRTTRAPEASTKASNADITFKDYIAQKAAEKQAQNPQPQPQAPKPVELKQQRKIPVLQKVQDTNGKDIFAAEVNVYSSDGSHALKTKTNALGKWQAQLPPGDYTVRVIKTIVNTGKKAEAQEKFTIPADASSTVNLKNILIER